MTVEQEPKHTNIRPMFLFIFMHVVLSPDPKVVASYFNALIQFTFAVWKILIIFVFNEELCVFSKIFYRCGTASFNSVGDLLFCS